MYNESELSAKKLPDLKEIGESLNIPKARYLRKPELVELILAHKAEDAAPETVKDQATKAPKPKAAPKKDSPKPSEASTEEAATVEKPVVNRPRPQLHFQAHVFILHVIQ